MRIFTERLAESLDEFNRGNRALGVKTTLMINDKLASDQAKICSINFLESINYFATNKRAKIAIGMIEVPRTARPAL